MHRPLFVMPLCPSRPHVTLPSCLPTFCPSCLRSPYAASPASDVPQWGSITRPTPPPFPSLTTHLLHPDPPSPPSCTLAAHWQPICNKCTDLAVLSVLCRMWGESLHGDYSLGIYARIIEGRAIVVVPSLSCHRESCHRCLVIYVSVPSGYPST